MKRMLLLLSWISLLGFACNSAADSNHETELPDSQSKGQQLMTQYCGACHVVPLPSDLDQKTWKNHILVRMGAYMGVYNDNTQYYDSVPSKWLEPGLGGSRVLAAGIYPAKPIISRPDWETLRDYILKNAPATTTAAPSMLPISRDLKRFQAISIRPNPELQPLVSAVAIDAQRNNVFNAAFFQQSILQVTAQGQVQSQVEGLYGPVFLNYGPAGLTVAEIGSFKGSDHPKGSIGRYKDFGQVKSKRPEVYFDSLMRPLMARWADLDGDGDLDAVLAEFGYHLGEMSWQENTGDNKFLRHPLYPDDGTVSIYVADFTGDGLPDILSLKANADERVDLYVNSGNANARFQANMLFRFNPTYGCSALEVVDWDGDGKLDFLVANGDNGDYPPILKPNHGIRLYLNKGNAQFEQAQYWPMNGAYGMRARDFDLDGDQDLAAVSFYPDYKARADEAFVYFENQGHQEFKAFTFPDVGLGRWMVMDAADADNDGDQDILLGAFNVKSDDCTEATYDGWMKNNVPLIFLENKTKGIDFPVSK